jgi:hypothetical protein
MKTIEQIKGYYAAAAEAARAVAEAAVREREQQP